MTEMKQWGFWKRNGVYFVGSGLAYVGAFGINFIHGGCIARRVVPASPLA